MRFITFLILLISLISSDLSSQCTPEDCSGSLPPYGGICDENLEEGEVNIEYDDFESFVLTQACFNAQEIDPGNPDIIIQIMEIYDFTFSGLPDGLTAETDEPSYSSMPGSPTLGCIALSGTPEQAGVFDVNADFVSDIEAYIIGSCPSGISLSQTENANYALSLTILPDPSFEGLEEEYCETDGDVELIVTGTPGGEFSGDGVTGNIFSPSDVGPGDYEITYTVSAQEGDATGPAENSLSIEVEVLDSDEYFADMDDDGFGDPDNFIEACEAPDGYVDNDEDCDDTNEDINPDADEECDGIDNNCDGDIDEDFDEDNDGFTSCNGDCDDDNNDVYPGAEEVCDGVDNNCDGLVDEGFDMDGDGFTSCDGDCDDTNADLNPGAEEVCDGIDNNCDGVIDEGFDLDGDGFTSCGGDCDDMNPDINPMAIDSCGIDNNCDGIFPDNVETMISLGICEGDTIIYENEPISEAGSYVIVLSASNGCDSIIILEITDETIMPTIAIEVDTICTSDNPLDLGSLVEPQGGVFEGPGIDGDFFNPELAGEGTHTINYSASNDFCEGSVSFDLSVYVCTSIEDEIFESRLEVFPNPASDLLYVKVDNEYRTELHIGLYNIKGDLIFKENKKLVQGVNQYVYDVDNFTEGIYILKLRTEKGIVSKRILIN